MRWTQYPTHIHLGQWYQPGAARKNVDGIVVAPAPVFWNIESRSECDGASGGVSAAASSRRTGTDARLSSCADCSRRSP